MAKRVCMRLSKVKENMTTRVIGHPLMCFRELASTNDMARDLAMIKAREGTVVLAETQVEARGRMNRKWASPSGGIWFSVILRPGIVPRHVSKLTLLASVAVAKAVERLFPLRVEIKWPNDVLVNHRKVCGILTEAKTREETTEFVVVGVGLNANFAVDILPAQLRDTVTTLMDEQKKKVDRESLLATLLGEFEAYYDLFNDSKFDAILAEWRNYASFLGSRVRVLSGEEMLEGTALDIDEDGALVMKLRDQTVRTVRVGDLTVLRHLE